eukprot:CAMPEP_0179313578 /NCGR_PEP_ID=MMETSP0797-20121207/53908_1 /TAXON_ID=47934 /ORGANISM="Dinophysis acuminata, Strain DAEP01" /LENGTH=74 /DNA_ID=CAMNT_0021023655 /DNA_START=78 /DNA_END=299 /DNA_ORIENTATION=-
MLPSAPVKPISAAPSQKVVRSSVCGAQSHGNEQACRTDGGNHSKRGLGAWASLWPQGHPGSPKLRRPAVYGEGG